MGKLPVVGSLSVVLNNVQHRTNLLNCLYYQHQLLTTDTSSRDHVFLSLFSEYYTEFPHWYLMGGIVPLFLYVLR